MRDAVVCAAVRTPVGKRGGGLSGVHAVDLSAHVLRALVERSGIDPAVVDDVFWGCVSQIGEQTYNVGRNAALAAGWPESVPGTTISSSNAPSACALAAFSCDASAYSSSRARERPHRSATISAPTPWFGAVP